MPSCHCASSANAAIVIADLRQHHRCHLESCEWPASSGQNTEADSRSTESGSSSHSSLPFSLFLWYSGPLSSCPAGDWVIQTRSNRSLPLARSRKTTLAQLQTGNWRRTTRRGALTARRIDSSAACQVSSNADASCMNQLYNLQTKPGLLRPRGFPPLASHLFYASLCCRINRHAFSSSSGALGTGSLGSRLLLGGRSIS